MTVIYNMSIDRADKPWIGDRRFTEMPGLDVAVTSTATDSGGPAAAPPQSTVAAQRDRWPARHSACSHDGACARARLTVRPADPRAPPRMDPAAASVDSRHSLARDSASRDALCERAAK